jgi:hypothetical protein
VGPVRSFGRTPGSRDCIKRGGGNPGQDGGYRDLSSRMWRSLAAHLFPKQEVTGPNPVIRSMDDTVQCELCDRDIPVATATVIPSIGYSCPPEDRTCQGHRREIMVRQTWWSGYRDVVTKQYGQLLGYEGSASYIRAFHPLLIPGLLHTDEYAFELRRVRMSEEQARRLVNLLVERQERLFDQPKPLETTFVFGEEALNRLIGGPTIMRRQLRHLLEVAERPTVSMQIVPFSIGAHAGLIGPFTLLGLQDSGEDLLFFEGAVGDVVNRDDEEMIISFTDEFEKLRSLALSEGETTTLINRMIEQIGHFTRTMKRLSGTWRSIMPQ